MPQAHNKHADALAAVASNIDISDERLMRKFVKKTLGATTSSLIPSNPIDEQDWISSIIHNLIHSPSTMAVKDLNDFIIIIGELHFQDNN